MSTLLRWPITGIKFLVQILVITWTTLAIRFSNLPWPAVRLGLAAAFAAFAIWAFWLSRERRMPAVAIALVLGVVAWYLTITPSHDRNWRPEVAVMPRAFIEGDHVRIMGIRNFDYRSRDDFTVRHEDRSLTFDRLGLLRVVLERRAGGAYVREFHLRQRRAIEHFDRDEAGGRPWF
jgi:hypothetical protein